jgi:hypothetical protein
MLISKMQTYFSDKMPPKKLKLKNKKWNLAKLENSFLSLIQVCSFEISIKFSIVDTLCSMTKKKNFTSQRAVFQILRHKNPKKIKTSQKKENACSKIVLDIFC